MKNFALRYLGSYILYTILGGLYLYFIDDKYAGFYGKEGAFRWCTILFYPFEALIGALLGYFILPYIPNKTRIISMSIMMIGFILIMIYDPNHYFNGNIFVSFFYLISLLAIPQFILPNFHHKEHKLDNNKIFVRFYLFITIVCMILLIYYILFEGRSE